MTQAAGILLAGVMAVQSTPTPARGADIEAGRRKAVTCAACHGPEGNSSDPKAPSLAGQVTIYLHWQLLLYRDRRRVDPQMAPIAAALSEADMADLAAFFAAQRPAPASAPPADAARVQAGRRLADAHHCRECHGRDLEGRDYAPRLRGLSREYLLGQMRGFKARTRGDLDGTMTSAVQPLSDEDIVSVTEYLLAGY